MFMHQVYSLRKQALTPARLLFNGEDAGPVVDHFFDFPVGRDEVGTVLNQLRPGIWRTPKFEVSCPSESDGPKVMDNGVERAVHDRLVSGSFYLHPEFGPGHVLRTDGSIAAFWDGVTCWVVRMENLTQLRVALGRGYAPTGESKKDRIQKLLDSI